MANRVKCKGHKACGVQQELGVKASYVGPWVSSSICAGESA